METFDVVVVGAGQAGLAVSYFLQLDHRSHVVLESGRIGESWLSQRWESFKLNTPNYMSVLPGLPYDGPEPNGFKRSEALVEYFHRYVEEFHLPVRTGMTVVSIDRGNGERFEVSVKTEGGVTETVQTRSIVLANGLQRIPKIPALHSQMPQDVLQLHTAEYDNPASLPPGSIVVVGSAQSGCQVVEDLLAAGREVYFCTSKVGRTPRRYRGRDVMEWMMDLGIFDITYESLEDKAITHAPQPQVSGLGRYGHTVSLQWLAGRGAVILGRLQGIEGRTLLLGDDAAENVRYADTFSQKIKDDIDAYLSDAGRELAPLEDDLADIPDANCDCVSALRELDIDRAGISVIIWATGFTGDLGWIHLPVVDERGNPIHERGVSPERGMYFLGYPWLHKRKSGIICGIEEDARYITASIADQLG